MKYDLQIYLMIWNGEYIGAKVEKKTNGEREIIKCVGMLGRNIEDAFEGLWELTNKELSGIANKMTVQDRVSVRLCNDEFFPLDNYYFKMIENEYKKEINQIAKRMHK